MLAGVSILNQVAILETIFAYNMLQGFCHTSWLFTSLRSPSVGMGTSPHPINFRKEICWQCLSITFAWQAFATALQRLGDHQTYQPKSIHVGIGFHKRTGLVSFNIFRPTRLTFEVWWFQHLIVFQGQSRACQAQSQERNFIMAFKMGCHLSKAKQSTIWQRTDKSRNETWQCGRWQLYRLYKYGYKYLHMLLISSPRLKPNISHKCSNCPVYNSVLRTPSNPAEIHGANQSTNCRCYLIYDAPCMVKALYMIKHLSKSMISRSLKVISGQCHILPMAYCKDHSIARLHEANARLHGQCYVDVDRHICILWQRGQVCGATWAIFDWDFCIWKNKWLTNDTASVQIHGLCHCPIVQICSNQLL